MSGEIVSEWSDPTDDGRVTRAFDAPTPLPWHLTAYVLTLDRALGDFETADILIEAKTITAVRPDISAPNAEVIDAARMIDRVYAAAKVRNAQV
jgi:hypothetical protein